MKLKSLTCITLASLTLSTWSAADPFESCPEGGFLVQKSVATLYGVNLATGYYEELSADMGTTGKLNAMGFNWYDNYLYAYSSQYQDVVRIHSNYQVETLGISGLPDKNFYVGDVSLTENTYYMYRPGSSYGLYKVSLDSTANNYLQLEKIIDGQSLNVSIYDFAFHPEINKLYSVDSSGRLIEIDSETGEYEIIRNVGQRGTFGAVYFDADGKLYISRNKDGYIYRVDIDADTEAEFFAHGPSSSNNDGARCAAAAIISETSSVDFGDAPESYGSSIENNGARHEISDDLYLGDSASGSNDGVTLLTNMEKELGGLVSVEAKGNGYLNGWVDWDKSGTFDNDEQVIDDRQMNDGTTRLLVDVPDDAESGTTWARIRYSSETDIGPNGGVGDGEVEDYQVVVTDPGLAVTSYPNGGDFATIAFEDRWPETGDYDLNDVVIAYRTRVYTNEQNQIARFEVDGRLLALGAGYHNGFAIMLDTIATGNINSELVVFSVNGQMQITSPLEDNAADDDAVLIISNDLWDEVNTLDDCAYYRTEKGCLEVQAYEFSLSIPLTNPATSEAIATSLINPFIFASPGWYHGDAFATPPGRSFEVHLKNRAVSARFNPEFFGLEDDASDQSIGKTFSSITNMPWAIEIPTLWAHPVEKNDVSQVYSEFPIFVQSNGESSSDWYVESKRDIDLTIINE